MRWINPALQARLDAGASTLCNCWRLERRDGLVLGFTDHDGMISLDDAICRPESGFSPSAQEGQTGLAPGSVEVEGVLRDDALCADDVRKGLFDGATIERWLVDWQETSLRHLLFRGILGAIECEGAAFRAEVLGVAAPLNRPLGRVFQPVCDARLGDGRCKVDLSVAGRRAIGQVSAVMAGAMAVTGLDGLAAGWFADGVLVWQTGRLAGTEAVVIAHRIVDGSHWLSLAEPGIPGDRFAVTVGCNHTLEHCAERFGNVLNFRGFPHMPGEDWALAPYPVSGVVHDGSAR